MKQNLVIRNKSFTVSGEPYALVRRPYGSDPGVRLYGYFFLVMPALIGGFLRHGRVDNDTFFYFILGIFMSSLTAFLALHMNLNTGGMFNEAFSEGCVKWGKARNVGEEPSTLDLTSVVF